MYEHSISELAQQFTGITYCSSGRSKGLDCIGLIQLFFRELGVAIPENENRGSVNEPNGGDPDRELGGMMSLGIPVPVTELKPLDLVYFWIGGGVSHAGVMVDGNHFLHVVNGREPQISPMDLSWGPRLVGARRLV